MSKKQATVKEGMRKLVSERGKIISTFEGYLTHQDFDLKRAWRLMMSDLRAGKVIVGFGTWKEALSREFPGKPLPANCPKSWTPKNMGYADIRGDFKKIIKIRSDVENAAVKLARKGEVAK